VTHAARELIVNGDDFGQSAGSNAGVVAAYEHGVLTSASLMVRWPAAIAAAEYARTHAGLAVGLHFDFGEWTYVDDAWKPLYEVVPLDDAGAIEAEARAQLARYRELLSDNPTHLDSHQHVHRGEPIRSILCAIARELDVPLRQCATVRYIGNFYGQTTTGVPAPDAITVDALRQILLALSAGVAELGCHPAAADDIDSMYRSERVIELHTLCDPRVRSTLTAEGIVLRSFRGLHGIQHEQYE